MVQAATNALQLGANWIVAQQNLAQQNAQFNYQKRLNALQMQREDNAYQRAVDDMRKAGLSPLGAVQSAAGGMTSAPAPQTDMSGVNEGFANAMQSAALRLQKEKQEAEIANINADTRSKDIGNTTLLERQLADLNLQLENIGIAKNNKQITSAEAEVRSEKLRQQIIQLEQEIESLKAGTANKVQEHELKAESAQYNRDVGHNPTESWSSSSSQPIGYGVTVGRQTLLNSKQEQEARIQEHNAHQQDLEKRVYDYLTDLKVWNQYHALQKTKAEKVAWERRNPKPQAKDYGLTKKPFSNPNKYQSYVVHDKSLKYTQRRITRY